MMAVYAITCRTDGTLYVGSSTWVAGRWQLHRAALRNGYHHCERLQRRWRRYGEEAFRFRILEEVEAESLLRDREIYWQQKLRPKLLNTMLYDDSGHLHARRLYPSLVTR